MITENRAPRLLALVLVMVAGSAWAAKPPSEADRLFTQARALMAKGNYAEACPMLEKSRALEPALGTLLNLADCLEKWGKNASAFLAFNEAAAWAANNHESKREEVANQRAQALKAKVTFVAVQLPSSVPGAMASLKPGSPPDAKELRSWKLDDAVQTVPVDPGSYALVVTAPSRKSSVVKFDVGQTPGVLRVDVPMLEPDQPPPPPPPLLAPAVEAPPPTPEVTGHSSVSAVGVVNVAAGGALVVAGAIGLGYSQSVISQVSRQQPGGPDYLHPTVTRGEYGTVQTLYPLSWVGLGVGVAALGTGAFLLLHNPQPSVTVSAAPMRDGVFASVSGSF